MIRIYTQHNHEWKECTLQNGYLIYKDDDGNKVFIQPDKPIVLDIFFHHNGFVTRNFDGAIPRWANAFNWNTAITIVHALREGGYIK